MNELRNTPTDLSRLLQRGICMEHGRVVVASETVARWRRDAPLAWARTRQLLRAEGVEIVIV